MSDFHFYIYITCARMEICVFIFLSSLLLSLFLNCAFMDLIDYLGFLFILFAIIIVAVEIVATILWDGNIVFSIFIADS